MLRISEQAEVEEAKLAKDEFALPEFADCILAKFREPLRVAMDGNCVEVNVPLRFVPKKAAPPDESAAPPQPSPG